MTEQSPPKSTIKTSRSLKETMMAVEWHGSNDIRVNMKRPRPVITKPTDAIVRITATTICESDLHLHHKEIPRMEKGDIMGQEGMGIVHEIGKQVLKFTVGERVVISSVIACGSCDYCKKGLLSCCDVISPNGSSEGGEKAYGTQAEYVRVPFADINLIHISNKDNQMFMEKSLLLSSVACKGLYACEMGKVLKGDIVGIWGAGPVGLMCATWAKYLGASRVIVIDSNQNHLQIALKVEGTEIINSKENKDVVGRMKILVPGGLDVAIDTVGIKYPTKSLIGKLEKAFFSETENCTAFEEAILCTKKGGNISLVGNYNTFTNHFRIGSVMDKSLTIRSGRPHSRNYSDIILPIMRENNIFTNLFTHHMSLSEASKGYKKLDKKEDEIIKILLIVDEKEFPHLNETRTNVVSGSRTSTIIEPINRSIGDEVVERESKPGAVSETVDRGRSDEVVEVESESKPGATSEVVSSSVENVPSPSTEPIERVPSEPIPSENVRRLSFESNALFQDTKSLK